MSEQGSTIEDRHFVQAQDWETSRIVEADKSKRRAWATATAFGVCLVMSLIAISIMVPLKETVPYVIRVDSATGVPDIVTAMHDQEITGDDAMNKHWMARYVGHRERYDWNTLQLDYDMVGLMSSELVGADYGAMFEGENALHERYKDGVRADIDIISVVPTSDSTGTVRYTKTTRNTDRGQTDGVVTRWVATLAFEYNASAKMSESDRIRSPFGFKVTSWRVDSEMAGGS